MILAYRILLRMCMQFQSMKDFLYLTGQMWDDDIPHHLMSWRPDLPVRIDRLIAGCCFFFFLITFQLSGGRWSQCFSEII